MWLAAAVLGVALLTAPTSGAVAGDPGPTAAPAPNVVLITADDQTLMEMRWLPQTRRLIGRAGLTFSHMIATHPNCCPSRAQVLTGQYAHNNGVRTNSPPWGGHESFDPSTALPVWLQRAGYATAFVGKYLHGYDQEDGLEVGWDRWRPIVGTLSDYHAFQQYADGELVQFGPEDYQTDAVAEQSRQLVRDLAGDQPFFLWSSFIAPHGTCRTSSERTCTGPPPAADRHADILGNVRLPALDSPSFNERDVSDKRPAGPERTVSASEQQHLFTQRIRTLAALDEAVTGIVSELELTGELADTVIMFTSDNGYLFGEHRVLGKNVPYEEAVRVPLLMRGPGIPVGERRSQTAAMIDLAPTIAHLAGATPMRRIDGIDLTPYLVADRRQRDRALLVQAGSSGEVESRAWQYRAVRTDRYTLVRWQRSRFWELYDRRIDPWQLTNVHDDSRYARIRHLLHGHLTGMLDCSGSGCRRPIPDLPAPDRR